MFGNWLSLLLGLLFSFEKVPKAPLRSSVCSFFFGITILKFVSLKMCCKKRLPILFLISIFRLWNFPFLFFLRHPFCTFLRGSRNFYDRGFVLWILGRRVFDAPFNASIFHSSSSRLSFFISSFFFLKSNEILFCLILVYPFLRFSLLFKLFACLHPMIPSSSWSSRPLKSERTYRYTDTFGLILCLKFVIFFLTNYCTVMVERNSKNHGWVNTTP